MEKNEMKFREGINEIDQNLSKMYLLTESLRQDSHIQYLLNTKGGIPRDKYLEIGSAGKRLSENSLIYTFPVYYFMLFRDNDFYVSSSQSSAQFSSFYGKFLTVEDAGVQDAADLKQRIFSGNDIYTFRRVDNISYYYKNKNKIYSLDDAILCTIKERTRLKNSATHAMTFVLSPDQLIHMLLADESRADGFLQISDSDNNILLQYGKSIKLFREGESRKQVEYGGDKYRLLTYTLNEGGWKVSIGFPYSIVEKQVQSIVNVIIVYIFAGFLMILGLAYYYSYGQYSGVKKLFVAVSGEEGAYGRGRNEYDVLNQTLHSITENKNRYKAQMEQLDQLNQAILLENLIVRGINTEKEAEEFKRYFIHPIEYFCVALMKLKAKSPEESQLTLLCIIEYLKECCPYDFTNVHTGISDELFLFSLNPGDEPNVNRIKELFESAVRALTKDKDIIFNIGISAVGTDLINVNVCYHQAQQVTYAFYSEFVNSVESYTISMNHERDNIVGIDFLIKLSNYILSGEKEGIRQQFEKLINHCQKVPLQYEMQKEQIFFAVRNLLYNSSLQIVTDSDEEIKLPDYRNNPAEQMLKKLEGSAFELCDYTEAKKNTRNLKLRNNIIQYIRDNYMDSSISASSLSQRFRISEKHLGQLIKEQTGGTYGVFLEQVRIQRAREALLTTNWSNERIAEETGFTAVTTFYRVFRKLTGISPGAYRDSNGKL